MGKHVNANVYGLTDELLHERLAAFEARFGMTSAQFPERYNRGELGDDLDFVDWAGLLYIASKAGATASAPA